MQWVQSSLIDCELGTPWHGTFLTPFSNSATETVKQELLFVGQESGKLIAIRDIIGKVTCLVM